MTNHCTTNSSNTNSNFSRQPATNPALDHKTIYRRLILDEIRNGRLSAYRRKRIVRYAAQLDLSAVETGQMIEQCKIEARDERMSSTLNLMMEDTNKNSDKSGYSRLLAAILCACLLVCLMIYIVLGT